LNRVDAAVSHVEPITVGQAGERLFVIRVHGRGTFQNCGGLKQFLDHQLGVDPDTELIIDLRDCRTMDSTFMGVVAGVGLRQRHCGHGKMVIVNLNEHTGKLLKTLGLTHVLDVRLGEKTDTPSPEGEFHELPETSSMSRLDRIRMMIEAHERLLDVEEGNEVKFQSVLTYLSESLNRAENGEAEEDSEKPSD
jgi:anti-anti-sigma factor